MPTLLEIFGLRFFFFSKEHEPVHIHVESNDGVAKLNPLWKRIRKFLNKNG